MHNRCMVTPTQCTANISQRHGGMLTGNEEAVMPPTDVALHPGLAFQAFFGDLQFFAHRINDGLNFEAYRVVLLTPKVRGGVK